MLVAPVVCGLISGQRLQTNSTPSKERLEQQLVFRQQVNVVRAQYDKCTRIDEG